MSEQRNESSAACICDPWEIGKTPACPVHGSSAAQDRCRCNPTESNGGSSTWCERCEKPKGLGLAASSAAQMRLEYRAAQVTGLIAPKAPKGWWLCQATR